MGNPIKIRLAQLGKKQVDLLEELQKRGFKTLADSTLCKIVNGRMESPQSDAVKKVITTILDEWEKEQKKEDKRYDVSKGNCQH